MSRSAKASAACPCGLQQTIDQCCGRYHAGAAAPTAEALMRSRYSAYVLGLGDYLLATWHASTRPVAMTFDDAPQWLGLSIKTNLPPNTIADDTTQATVEFVARYKIGGRAHKLHEISRFVREDGRWYYVDGEIES